MSHSRLWLSDESWRQCQSVKLVVSSQDELPADKAQSFSACLCYENVQNAEQEKESLWGFIEGRSWMNYIEGNILP